MPPTPPPDPSVATPQFTLALHRNPGVPANWRLRFEVSDGAFILRTRRAGIDLDGPPLARGEVDVGAEDILDSLRLRLVDVSGARNATYRISQPNSTVPGQWAPLQPGGSDADGTIRLLPPDTEDDVTAHGSATGAQLGRTDQGPPARIVKHLRRELNRTRLQAEALAAKVAELEETLARRDDPSARTTLVP